MTDVQGYCPMGCGPTLFLGSGGYVTCARIDCPRPDAVADLLDDREVQHVITFTDVDFTIRHPLRERLDGRLEDCQLHRYVAQFSGPPADQLGQYRAYENGDGYEWVRIGGDHA